MSLTGKPWLTAVMVFQGTSAQWQGETIDGSQALLNLFATSYFATEQGAEDSAKGQSESASLTAGQSITLIAVDSQSYYYDNVGGVNLTIALRPNTDGC